MAQLPALEIVSVMGVGYDGVDVAAAKAQGVVVTHTPDVLNDDVADLALGLMLVCRPPVAGGRPLGAQRRLAAKGAMPLARKMSGARLGVLGMGRIGQAIAQRAQAFGMSIAYTRAAQAGAAAPLRADAGALAAESDFLVSSRRVAPARARSSMPRCWRPWAPRASSSTWRAVRWSTRQRSSMPCSGA
jgi:hydroxypyruvate reductase